MSLIKMCDFTKISFHFISNLGIYFIDGQKIIMKSDLKYEKRTFKEILP